jgi:hypothetical protein
MIRIASGEKHLGEPVGSPVSSGIVGLLPDGRLSAVNAALYLGYAPKTLAQMRSQGRGPRYIKRAGRIWYYKAALDDWLAHGDRPIDILASRSQRAMREAPRSCVVTALTTRNHGRQASRGTSAAGEE